MQPAVRFVTNSPAAVDLEDTAFWSLQPLGGHEGLYEVRVN